MSAKDEPQPTQSPNSEGGGNSEFAKEHCRDGLRLSVTTTHGTTLVRPEQHRQIPATALLVEALGTSDPAIVKGLLAQLVNASRSKDGEAREDELNFAFAIVRAIKPTDAIEQMLASQMVATHMLTMTYTWKLAIVDNIQQEDSTERVLNKLMRTFALQVETLKRYQSGSEGRITTNVSVAEGGQAFVGTLTQAVGAPPDHVPDAAKMLPGGAEVPMTLLGKNQQPTPHRRRRENR